MRGALAGIAGGTVIAIALTESFSLLPAALATYAAAWWVLRLEDRSTRQGDPR